MCISICIKIHPAGSVDLSDHYKADGNPESNLLPHTSLPLPISEKVIKPNFRAEELYQKRIRILGGIQHSAKEITKLVQAFVLT